MAVPAYTAASLVPGLTAPGSSSGPSSIFTTIIAPPEGSPFMTGVINRNVEWIFAL